MTKALNFHCYSSFTFSYLSRARVLAKTLRAAHPDWVIWAVIVDEVPPGVDGAEWTRDFDHVIYAKDLGIPEFRPWLFKHDIVEACTAVKGHMLMHLLRTGASHVVYLDPDIAVFHPLSEIIQDLSSHSIVLTPHQVSPNKSWQDVQDNEMTSLVYGIYNLGFVAVKNDYDGNAFAEWWASRLYDACYDDVTKGIFTDQKYCDIVPALFGGVYVERDPGYNVASWNLSQRTLSFDLEGRILVNQSPLKFYHFTKIGSAGDVMTERYARGRAEIFEVWEWYRRFFKMNEVEGLPNKYWAYAKFDNGEMIPKAARILFREIARPLSKIPDPYRVDDGSFYLSWKSLEASLPVVDGFGIAG